jgi:hypothetical protein
MDKLVLGTAVAGLLFFMSAEAKADDLLQERLDCITRVVQSSTIKLGSGMIDLLAWECSLNKPNPVSGKITPNPVTLNTILRMNSASKAVELAREDK